MQNINYHWVREIEFDGEDLHHRREQHPGELHDIIDKQAQEIRMLKNFIFKKNLLSEYEQYKENIQYSRSLLLGFQEV